MAATLVAHTSAGSATGQSITTTGITTTGSSLIVLAVGYYDTRPITGVSDSLGNTWTALTAIGTTGNAEIQFFYCSSPTVGTGHTFTATTAVGGSYPAIAVSAFSGTVPGTTADVNVAATASQPGSATPAVNAELVLTAMSSRNSGTISVNQSFTITDQVVYVSGDTFGVTLAYLNQAAAAALDPTWSVGGGPTNPASAMASFKTQPVLLGSASTGSSGAGTLSVGIPLAGSGSTASTGAATVTDTVALTSSGSTGSTGAIPRVMLGVPGASSPAESDFQTFNSLIAPRSIDVMLFLQDLNSEPPFYSAYKTWSADLGAMMMPTMSPTITLGSFTAGTYDTTGLYSNAGLEGLATTVATYGKPVIIRLAHEFNGDWNSYGYGGSETAASFVGGWQHIVSLFRSHGATNALWCWCPNCFGTASGYSTSTIDPTVPDGSGVNWYPGDNYVDIVALDGYMYSGQAALRTPANLFSANYESLMQIAPSKQFAIGEFGVTEDARLSSIGGKAGWYSLLFELISTWPNCILANQWQRGGSPDYTISSSGTDTASAAAFVAGALAAPLDPYADVMPLLAAGSTGSSGTAALTVTSGSVALAGAGSTTSIATATESAQVPLAAAGATRSIGSGSLCVPLKFAPPAQSSPTTIVVPSTGGTYGSSGSPYSATTDIIFDVHTNAPITGTVRWYGGRHVRMIGGVFEPTSSIGNYVIVGQQVAGSFFAEGLEFPDESAAAPDVIDVCGDWSGSTNGYAPDIYLQNIRCLKITANNNTNHADFFQPQGEIGTLYCDKLTVSSNYDVFTIAADSCNNVAPVGAYFSRVNTWWYAANSVNPYTAHYWINSATGAANHDTAPFPITFEDVYADSTRATATGGGRVQYASEAIYPNYADTAGGGDLLNTSTPSPFTSGEDIGAYPSVYTHGTGYAYFTDPLMQVTGIVTDASPSAGVYIDADGVGSYVPAGIGTNYVSPGYEPAVSLAGAGSTGSQGTASLSVAVPLAAAGSTGSTGTATDSVKIPLSGAGATSSAGTVNLTDQIALAGTGATGSTGTATLATAAGLSASGSTATTGSATPSVALPLAGTGSTSSQGATTLGDRIPLSGSGTSGSTGTATLKVTVAETATGSTASAGTGTLSVAVPCNAAGATTSIGAAGLSASGVLSAAGSTSSTGHATLSSATPLAGAGSSTSVGAGTPTDAVSLAGTSASSSTGSATLTPVEGFAAAGATSSTGVGILSTADSLNAAGSTRSAGTATFSIAIPLDAVGQTTSTGSATTGDQVPLAGVGNTTSIGSGTASPTILLAGGGATDSTGVGTIVLTITTPGVATASDRLLWTATVTDAHIGGATVSDALLWTALTADAQSNAANVTDRLLWTAVATDQEA